MDFVFLYDVQIAEIKRIRCAMQNRDINGYVHCFHMDVLRFHVHIDQYQRHCQKGKAKMVFEANYHGI